MDRKTIIRLDHERQHISYADDTIIEYQYYNICHFVF